MSQYSVPVPRSWRGDIGKYGKRDKNDRWWLVPAHSDLGDYDAARGFVRRER
jgi:hypothetical protein